MYLRVLGGVHFPGTADGQENQIWLSGGGKIRTDTYMNAFDIGAWKKYTSLSQIALIVWLKGEGNIRILYEREGEAAVCLAEESVGNKDFGQEGWKKYRFQIPDSYSEGILYLEFIAEKDTVFQAWFENGTMPEKEIYLSLVVCTYRRQEQLKALIDMLRRESKDGSGENGGWLRVRIIDNASELSELHRDGIRIYHNPNTGGAGGFSRGIEETIREWEQYPATHVVFMDDDAALRMESLYRLRAVLAFCRDEYEGEVVAGRMFRLDKPHIQYTAAEVWNKGDIRHIGWNQDMSARGCLWRMNENQGGEYGGWWFACFPIAFVRENMPLPFFLHCDDVEYGLRHGGTPIILNGIQVWHETFEHRQDPVRVYYDTRNPMIVNAVRHLETDARICLRTWKNKISTYHVKRDYLSEYMAIRAMGDFLRGQKWFLRVDSGRLHRRLQKVRKHKWLRLWNAVLWRIVEMQAGAILRNRI